MRKSHQLVAAPGQEPWVLWFLVPPTASHTKAWEGLELPSPPSLPLAWDEGRVQPFLIICDSVKFYEGNTNTELANSEPLPQGKRRVSFPEPPVTAFSQPINASLC